MRHHRIGRKLGRNPNHQRALLRSLVIALLMTERDTDGVKFGGDENKPYVRGRIITTLEKAKEVRPFVERCVTLARKAQRYLNDASKFATSAERNTTEWKKWRESDVWAKWNQAIAPAVALRRRAFQLIGNKDAVKILFDVIGPRFEDRNGGYTRIMKLAKPRLGDAGKRAIIEFVTESETTGKVSVE
ncbi:MAG: 50S ribosomal protein L17 [Planctomycetaceae bacterium]|nr:50S ribosomal protein L17 [Planctomycetaceae bacterium]